MAEPCPGITNEGTSAACAISVPEALKTSDDTYLTNLLLLCRGSVLNALTFPGMVNSAAVSTSAGVYAAPATGFSSNSAASTPASVATAVPPQTAVQPVVVSPLSIGRPGRVHILQLWTLGVLNFHLHIPLPLFFFF